MSDKVNSPKHYTSHPSGVECINITEHYNFCVGNAIKYLWRQGLKEENGYEAVDKQIEDCKKAIWYINRHIESLSKSVPKPLTNKQKVDLLNTIMKPGQIKAPGAWMLDREAAARAAIAEVQEPKTWLDCDD